MEMDQSTTTLSSSVSSEVDDEDNECLVKDSDESTELNPELNIDNSNMHPKESTDIINEKVQEFQKVVLNNFIRKNDSNLAENVHVSSVVTSASPVHEENQNENIVRDDETSDVTDNMLEPMSNPKEVERIACTENHSSNVDSSYVNNIDTFNVKPLIPCDELSRSLYSIETKTVENGDDVSSEGTSNTDSSHRNDKEISAEFSDCVKDLNSEDTCSNSNRTNKCSSKTNIECRAHVDETSESVREVNEKENEVIVNSIQELIVEKNDHTSRNSERTFDSCESSLNYKDTSRTYKDGVTNEDSSDVAGLHDAYVSESVNQSQLKEFGNLENALSYQSTDSTSTDELTVNHDPEIRVSNATSDCVNICDKLSSEDSNELLENKNVPSGASTHENEPDNMNHIQVTSSHAELSKINNEKLDIKCDRLVDYGSDDSEYDSFESDEENYTLRTNRDGVQSERNRRNESIKVNNFKNSENSVNNALSAEIPDTSETITSNIDSQADSFESEKNVTNSCVDKIKIVEIELGDEEESSSAWSQDTRRRSSKQKETLKDGQRKSLDNGSISDNEQLEAATVLESMRSYHNHQHEKSLEDTHLNKPSKINETNAISNNKETDELTTMFKNNDDNSHAYSSSTLKDESSDVGKEIKNEFVQNNSIIVCDNDSGNLFTNVITSQKNLPSIEILKAIEVLIEESKAELKIEEQENGDIRDTVFRISKLIQDSKSTGSNEVDINSTLTSVIIKIKNTIEEHKNASLDSCKIQHSSVNILERIEQMLPEACKDKSISSDSNQYDKGMDFEKNNRKASESEQEDLEMGVFEESNESEGESTDTAETEDAVSTEEAERASTKSLKRKLSLDPVQTSCPPAKKLAMSSDGLSQIQCKKCKVRFRNEDDAARHFLTCMFQLENGLDNADDNLKESRAEPMTLPTVPKSISITPKKTNHLLKNSSTSSLVNSALSLSKRNSSPDTTGIDLSSPPKFVDGKASVTRKVFLCAACHVYFEYWNLYLHMLEQHKRFICLYCLGMFGSSANLSQHLVKHHSLCIKHIANEKSLAYKEYTSDSYILTCTTCGMFVEDNDLNSHNCDTSDVVESTKAHNSSSESYPDPESFMLATMTEGDGHKNKKSVQVVSLGENEKNDLSKSLSPIVQLPTPTGSDNLTRTINEVAENRTNQCSPTTESIVVQPDPSPKPQSSPPPARSSTPPTVSAPTPPPEIVSSPPAIACSPPATAAPLPSPPPASASSPPSSSPSLHPPRLSSPSSSPPIPPSPPSTESASIALSASAALSELEKCHRLLIADNSDDETGSDVEDSLLNSSIVNCASESIDKPLEQSPSKAKSNESDSSREDSSAEKASSSDESEAKTDESETKAKKNYLEKIKDASFDAKVVLDKLNLPAGDMSVRLSEDGAEITSIPSEKGEEKSKGDTLSTTPNSSHLSIRDAERNDAFPIQEISKLDSFHERAMSPVSENDDDNRDFNDSDTENSLKIDDSVFEDDDDGTEEAPEIGKQLAGSKATDKETREEMLAAPAFKINPLRIKIKCSNSGDTYERIKTETEIKEKEARERRYDGAIDEVIRKSLLEYEQKEAEREQREKDEYERLQQELAKKQEEYQRMQDQYVQLQTAQSKREENDRLADAEEEIEEGSIEHDETLEDRISERKMEVAEHEDEKENEKEENVERETEERVKLIERNNDEKSSLLKEELLKKCEKLFAGVDQLPEEEPEPEPAIPLASEEIQPMALSLDDRLENLDIRLVVKECVRTSCTICVYCYHATRIVVNGKQLALHVLAEHRYTPVKNDTTDDLIQFIKNNLNKLEEEFFSSDTFDAMDKACFNPFDNVYYCLQCSFASKHQRDLTSHKRKMHPKTSQICLLCKQILLNQSELLFHYCAGVANTNPQDNIYWCGVCGLDKIPSAFRLMVHLRKKHNTCNVCLESCANEGKLLQHMLKHKIIHMCYKCNISYRNKQDITKHLFWKHGTESIVCKKCLQKRWSHVYHFCQPPARFTCDECNLTFKKSVSLKVHKRIHAGIFPYECSEENCDEKFVSKKLLDKHIQWHREPPKPTTPPPQDSKVDANTSEPHIDVCNLDDSVNPVHDLKLGGKSKKKKKSKFDLNSMNLPPLNLSSDSDSSDDDLPSEAPSISADTEETKTEMSPSNSTATGGDALKTDVSPSVPDGEPNEKPSEPPSTSEPQKGDVLESPAETTKMMSPVSMPDLTAELSVQPAPPSEPLETKPLHTQEQLPTISPDAPEVPPDPIPDVTQDIVPDVWDQFKSFTQSLNVYRHVDDEHDYHIVYEKPREEEKPAVPPSELTKMLVQQGEALGPVGNVDDSQVKSADTTLNKTTSDDSSSDSSSSSSCGSQCGSNCSCSSSSSSSSSSSEDSSSDSDSSDPENRKKQEEKRQKKRKKVKGKHHHSDDVNVTIENEEPEKCSVNKKVEVSVHEPAPPLPPPIHESDLDTDVTSSDEDFYDEKPQMSAPKVGDKSPLPPAISYSSPPLPAPPSPPLHYPAPPNISIIPPVAIARTPSRAPKKVKRPRMRNVPTSTPKLTSTPFKTSFKHPFMKPSPAFEQKKSSVPLISSVETPPAGRSPNDDHTRSSKRKRKQNRFYGYSDDEDLGEYDNDESDEYSIVKQPPLKKKLFWKPSFNDKIPLPLASPPQPPYENKIRIENPFKSKVTPDYESFRHSSPSPPPEYSTTAYPSHATSSSDEADPTMEAYHSLAAMPPPPIVPPQSSVPLYCYCRCPYDEVSEMIACDGDDCEIEWYHFECVNILVPPKGKWYCPQCRPKYQPI